MSSALHVKLFNQFKEITDNARSMVSRHIYPILEGGRAFESDAVLADLYEEWQAGCRAAAAGLQRTLYPNEYAPMPKMPVDDEAHQPCRQMAAVLIERTVYDEQIAQRWFHAAAENIKNHPACANHTRTCACKMALEGWTYADNLGTAKQLKAFYDAHYEQEKNEDYLQAVRDVAKLRGRTFEQQMEHDRLEQIKALAEAEAEAEAEAFLAHVRAVANMRGTTFEEELQRQHKQKADLERYEEIEAAKKKAKAEKRKGWVFICYQNVGEDILKHTNGKTMHGYYRVVKKADCYEFMIMETDLTHPDWWKAIAEKHVERIPLDMAMGVKDTAFEDVTPEKIHTV